MLHPAAIVRAVPDRFDIFDIAIRCDGHAAELWSKIIGQGARTPEGQYLNG
jgi:hypothetical protein